MRKLISIVGLIGLLSLAAAMTLVGCSDNKSTNSNNTNTLSAQDQYDLIDLFLNLENDSTKTTITSLPGPALALGLLDINFLDGVDESDVEHLTIPGLGKRIGSDPSSASLSITFTNGWWTVTLDSAFTNNGLSGTVTFIDSVRFEMVGGQAQQTPDPSTSTMRLHAHATVTWNGTYLGGDLEGDFAFGTISTLSGLTSAAAMLNTNSSGTFGADYQQGGTTYNLAVGLTGQTANITAPITIEGLGCPNGGAISATMVVAASADDGETQQSANATWTLTGQVQEGGIVPYTIQSGSFTKSGTTDFGCGS